MGDYKGLKKPLPFMKYVRARYKKDDRRKAFEIYLTDTLYYYAHGKAIGKRYSEFFEKPIKQKPAEQIINDVVKRAGLVRKNESS